MARTIVSPDADDRRGLEKKPAVTGREEEAIAFEKLLQESAGTWEQGEGLKYQQQMRSERR